ncbi:hypothetical protein [Rhodobium gokarnense]|uniref:Uncharacterized protein n=1 Tax=Rhodobium gokarnense TaxID=364296 RepID=A0ABT3HA01_9HYPH|nr:hypothetical protein [Rhodobium gokarnense]MCW2307226.1 hypothetical protein [Rhodobium gokarnense]
MRHLAVAAALGLCAAMWAAPAGAVSPSPYDMTYRVRSDTPVRSGMSSGASVKGTLKAGTKGIVLRWCRPEIPFAEWQFGSRSVKRKLLDERWCEIQSGTLIGNVDGKALRPD